MEMGMTLVTIDSSSKSDEINFLVKNNFGKVNLWIGGIMSRFPYRHFIWLSTGKPFSYTYWQGNNPDFFASNEYCAHIGWGSNLEWNDMACTNHHGFICEPNQQLLQTKQLQQEVEKEKQKVQDLQKELQLKIQKQNELQDQVQDEQKQKDKLQQELDKIKATNVEEKSYREKIQEQLEEYKQKLMKQIKENEKLQEDLKEANSKEYKLQQDLISQQNLKDLAEEELQKLKANLDSVTNEKNKKYRDIILHFHQNVLLRENEDLRN